MLFYRAARTLVLAFALLAGCGDATVHRSGPDGHDADDAVAADLADVGQDSAPSVDTALDLAGDTAPSVDSVGGDTAGMDTMGGVDTVAADTAVDLGPPPTIPGQQVDVGDRGVSARFGFVDAYDNVANGDWYRGDNNEGAVLAWGESYVMMALASIFRATGDVRFLDRLAAHADSALAQRDDRRGVTDYRGVSAACWRNTSYQTAGEAYCYTVHSGMLGYPMVELARLVRAYGLESEPTYDGSTLGAKADAYVQAGREIVAAHDDQWNSAGYYAARSSATFLSFAGRDLPLNQSNAMGRLLLVMHQVTGEAAYLDKATRLAQRFKNQLSTGANGEYLWNYWGGTYASPGEDISHAAINVDFAVLAAAQGVVFTNADLDAFARTFLGPIYINDGTISDHVGGGATNGASYLGQLGRWLRLTPRRTAIYAAVRDLYAQRYPSAGIGSGSLLYSWALLAEYEPVHRDTFFYSVDWNDPNPSAGGDWRQATAANANILTTPADLARPSVARLQVNLPRETRMQQYDGTAYHTVLVWRPTGGAAERWLTYEPEWPHVYWNGGVLYQLNDAFVAGQGLQVRESTGFAAPTITSSPPAQGVAGQPLSYVPAGTGDAPSWWSLSAFPVGARVDPATGALAWTPPGRGVFHFALSLRNDYGVATQAFDVTVP